MVLGWNEIVWLIYNPLYFLLLIIACGGGGAYYFLQVMSLCIPHAILTELAVGSRSLAEAPTLCSVWATRTS